MCRKLIIGLSLLLLIVDPSVRPTAADSLTIVTKTRSHEFTVEVALTEADKARGLMYRRVLPMGHGMLFGFVPAQEVSFWMKNTYISLDVIFIGADGRIRRIAANTQPVSARRISSGGPVRGVLEVLAGTAERLGIMPGDRVVHRIFNRR
jgi:uncharacterized protein